MIQKWIQNLLAMVAVPSQKVNIIVSKETSCRDFGGCGGKGIKINPKIEQHGLLVTVCPEAEAIYQFHLQLTGKGGEYISPQALYDRLYWRADGSLTFSAKDLAKTVHPTPREYEAMVSSSKVVDPDDLYPKAPVHKPHRRAWLQGPTGRKSLPPNDISVVEEDVEPTPWELKVEAELSKASVPDEDILAVMELPHRLGDQVEQNHSHLGAILRSEGIEPQRVKQLLRTLTQSGLAESSGGRGKPPTLRLMA